METTVENVMTSVVVCAQPDYTVDELMQIMDNEKIHCMPIINKEGCCVGIVSPVDLLRSHKFLSSGDDLRAEQILSQPAIAIPPQGALLDAAKLMISKNVCHLVVVKKDELIGIVSVMDVLEEFLSESDPDYVKRKKE